MTIEEWEASPPPRCSKVPSCCHIILLLVIYNQLKLINFLKYDFQLFHVRVFFYSSCFFPQYITVPTLSLILLIKALNTGRNILLLSFLFWRGVTIIFITFEYLKFLYFNFYNITHNKRMFFGKEQCLL